MDLLIYLAVALGLLVLVVGGITVSKKYNIQKEDYEFVAVLLGLVNYVTKQFDWKYSVGIADVMELVMEAVYVVRDTHDIVDNMLLKEYILDEAEDLCEERGLDVDDEFVEMLKVAIDYLIA